MKYKVGDEVCIIRDSKLYQGTITDLEGKSAYTGHPVYSVDGLQFIDESIIIPSPIAKTKELIAEYQDDIDSKKLGSEQIWETDEVWKFGIERMKDCLSLLEGKE